MLTTSMSVANSHSALILLIAVSHFSGCGPSVEELVDGLDSSGEDLEWAKQELLLAKGQAVPVLLSAFEDPRHASARPELAEVLVGLMRRVEAPGIATALERHMVADADPRVRARIARELGLYKQVEFADAFMQALEDTSSKVRREAITALGLIKLKLDADQRKDLIEKARLLADDDDRDTRLEARMIVADRVNEWLTKANNEQLKGRLAVADSLYHVALAYSPESKKANLQLGRFYFDNGQRSRGLQVLRDSGWLLDIPHVLKAPELDGRLDDDVWRQATKTSPFFTWSSRHSASILAERHTEVSVIYTDEALYFGAYCEDASPESLVVQSHERDHADEWNQDLVEFFLDTNFDQRSSCKITINSVGAITDATSSVPNWKDYDYAWSAESEAVGYAGQDFWSLEVKLVLGQPYFPKPHPGTLWGCDMSRGYRGARVWSQWTRTLSDYGSPHKSYGWFLFK